MYVLLDLLDSDNICKLTGLTVFWRVMVQQIQIYHLTSFGDTSSSRNIKWHGSFSSGMWTALLLRVLVLLPYFVEHTFTLKFFRIIVSCKWS